jgi:HEAT repeats
MTPLGMLRLSVALAALATPLHNLATAQSIADRIREVREGEIRLSFAAREGICGDGRTYIRDRSQGENNYMSMSDGSGTRGWKNRPCEDGPVRVSLRIRGGEVRSARTYVGGAWPEESEGVTDLGHLPARGAAVGLIELARTTSVRGGGDVIFPATIADSFAAWPPLLSLAKDKSVGRATRKQAVFWVSQAAGEKVAEGLGELVGDDDEDREVRDQAVFALSQLPREEGIPILVRVARGNRDPAIRKKAMFWLGQSEDPRALALFEEILGKPD